MEKKNPFNLLIERAKTLNDKTIVFPEGEDKRVRDAVKMLVQNKTCKVVVLGNSAEVKDEFEKEVLSQITFINTREENDKRKEYIDALFELRKSKGITIEQAEQLVSLPIYYGSMMVKLGDADGMVAGAVLHSADVMRPVFQIIKQRKDIVKASSCFIMEVPDGRPFGENGFMIFADCAVNQYPNAEELASIALASRDSAKYLCGMTPKIGMLSYSTASNGSDDETIIKIKKAIEIFKEHDTETMIDGEMQADSAILPETAKRKMPNSPLAGDANVLIFPDINAGNIGYKLVQHFSHVRAVGPILQGLNKPVNDLSRSATAEEIYLTAVITLLQTQNN
jgi:phosphate acetyltransferase